MTEHHTDELDTARFGATADLVYLLDAARHHLEACEELAIVSAQLESPDLDENEVVRLRSLVTSFAIQADAMRELHRKTLDNFIDSRPGPAERKAQQLLKSLKGTKERREQQATRRQTGR